MARDLRKRVTLAIIIPLVLGMLIITAVTCVPLYIEYSNYIDNYDQHMVSYEEHIMVELNKVIAVRQGVGVLSLAASLAQLSASLITNFYYGRIEQNQNWITKNLILQYQDAQDFSDTVGIGNSSSSNIKSDIYYRNSTIFYYFLQPIVKIGESFSNVVLATFLTYPNDFSAFFPANQSFYESFMNDSQNGQPTRSFYWIQSSVNRKLTFVPETYNVVCKPLFVQQTSIGTLPCVIYSLNNSEFEGSKYSDKESLSVVDSNYVVYYPPKYHSQDYCNANFQFYCKSCQTLYSVQSSLYANCFPRQLLVPDPEECKIASAVSSNASHTNTIIKYEYNGNTHVASVSPVNISLPIVQDSLKSFSTVLSTKKSEMSQKFDKLSVELTGTIIIQIAVFSVVLIVIILVVCLISYKITSSVIAPIDDLYTILKRLHTDLGVNVKSHEKKGPPEVINLYEVFDRLRLILRFEDAKLFKDPTYAMMNYAQALKLFHSFNNKRAMEKCFQEIGHIHMINDRYLEAAMNYHCSLLISQEIELGETEIAAKQINTAIAMLKAKAKTQRAKTLFYEALNYYSSQPIPKKLPVYLELIECLLLNQDSVASEMSRAEEYLSILNEQCEDHIINQRFRYLLAFQAYNKNQFRLAAELCTETLESFPETDRQTRGKCLKLLKKIFKKFSVNTEQIEVLSEALKECPKDLVVVIDKKIGEAINDEMFHELTDKVFEKDDRISYIQFDESCQVVYNMTTMPRRRGSTLGSLLEFQNKCVLYDAIYLALVQINSMNSMIPQSFLSKEAKKKEWIFVITYGEDFGSAVSEEKLWNRIYSSSANLVIVVLNASQEALRKLEAMVGVTPFGILIAVNDFFELPMALLRAGAFISQSNSLSV